MFFSFLFFSFFFFFLLGLITKYRNDCINEEENRVILGLMKLMSKEVQSEQDGPMKRGK